MDENMKKELIEQIRNEIVDEMVQEKLREIRYLEYEALVFDIARFGRPHEDPSVDRVTIPTWLFTWCRDRYYDSLREDPVKS